MNKITLNRITLKCSLIALALTTFQGGSAQYRYGLTPVNYRQYQEGLNVHPEKKLIDLEGFIPGIVLDIRYATANNFTHKPVYKEPKAFLRLPVAEALRKAQEDFETQGFAIKVFDAYRPYAVTVFFYETYLDTTYVASPYKGSRHNRGCAVDMTIIDARNGKELRMPTGYDSFQKEAWPTFPVKDPEVLKNRTLLITTMEKYGFKVNASEWWHFDFTGWKNYDVMDIDFSLLKKNQKK
jgi:zinc D-Ala-D-Ala dipeptidase